jgi:TonB family protein
MAPAQSSDSEGQERLPGQPGYHQFKFDICNGSNQAMIGKQPSQANNLARASAHNRFESTGGRFLATTALLFLIAGTIEFTNHLTGNQSATPLGCTNRHTTSPPRTGAAHEPDFGPYMATLQHRIKSNWKPPKSALTKRVICTFDLSRDGSLSKLRLLQTSGSADADERALLAVQTAAPFEALPDGAAPSVPVKFTFDYNVMNNPGHRPQL